ncbi:hypothetical protein Pst134EA_033420 [Puccinia striiformis f. sp. tritici]|uniref:hypothetical protein n=1 Tax=Puccinia striiformis f. sp. tritici TaxID=168172 RepID=UPI00200820F0|nr:hypothetical protein Pst134EA_033420 [Puccinia striiformis f. sp. tritici]KAH9468260.1 hypothetical protein Pst134EA_033420 [Puccinia striiformis f. sp. tritici]
MDLQVLQGIVTAQSAALATTRRINTVLADTVNILLEDDENLEPPVHGGSRPGRQPNLERGFEEGYQRLYRDYLAPEPIYGDNLFRRRFRMHRELFIKIVDDVTAHDDYFQRKADALGKFGLYPVQKIASALRMLAYGGAADMNDKYFRLAESTSMESLHHFCNSIIDLYDIEFRRRPNEEDIRRLTAINAKRGFPGMLGSLDCMHWCWKNCPAAWKGQFQGKEKVATIVLEAVASHDLWFWHSFFGLPGGHNDINILDRSPLFKDLLNDEAPCVQYKVNGNTYEKCYFLADGIYPDWSTLIKTISAPQGQDKKHFAKMQEACRKDVERAFGVLQARFAIVAQPARTWSREKMQQIMKTCVILHNMIINSERDLNQEFIYDSHQATVTPNRNRSAEFSDFIRNAVALRESKAHFQLRDDLVRHLWTRKGASSTESNDDST